MVRRGNGRGRGGGRGRRQTHRGRGAKPTTRVVHTYSEINRSNKNAELSDDSDSVSSHESEDAYQKLMTMVPTLSKHSTMLKHDVSDELSSDTDSIELNEKYFDSDNSEISDESYEVLQETEIIEKDDDESDDAEVASNEKDMGATIDSKDENDTDHEEDVEDEQEVELEEEKLDMLDIAATARHSSDLATQDLYIQHFQRGRLAQGEAQKLTSSRMKLVQSNLPFTPQQLGISHWNTIEADAMVSEGLAITSLTLNRIHKAIQSTLQPKSKKRQADKQNSPEETQVACIDLVTEYGIKQKIAEQWSILHSDYELALRRTGVTDEQFLSQIRDPNLQLIASSASDIRRRRKRFCQHEENVDTKDPNIQRLHQSITTAFMSPVQQLCFDVMASYRDLMYLVRNVDVDTQIRSVAVLHIINHVVKARDLEIKHTGKIRSALAARKQARIERRIHRETKADTSDDNQFVTDETDAQDPSKTLFSKQESLATEELPEFRDQGYTRPRVLVLVPHRHNALQFIRMFMRLLPDREFQHKSRFFEEFSDPDADMNAVAHYKNEIGNDDWLDDANLYESDQSIYKKHKQESNTDSKRRKKPNKQPIDFKKTFEGNVDDAFRVGIAVARKSVRLYAEFYHADIIVASPLGLRMNVGAEEEDKDRDIDFLSSIEIALIMQADTILMQNWDHLVQVFTGLNHIPRDMHDTDFSRVREMYLEGMAKYFRQTILFSDRFEPQFMSLFRKYTSNVRGLVCVRGKSYEGTITRVIPTVKQVFYRLQPDSVIDADEKKFDYFTRVIYPQLRAASTTDTDIQPHTLLYVPSYLDFVRIRNFLQEEDVDIAPISEYSPDEDVTRARTMFFQNRLSLILTTERFHYYRRLRIRGARHLVFYGVPTIPQFYNEYLNALEEASSQSHPVSCLVLFSKYEKTALERVVGSSRCKRMLSSTSKPTFLFC